MSNLITYSDFSTYIDVSVNITSAKRIDPYIKEAQEFDIRELLGDLFYQRVTASPSTYATLLNGGTYTYEGETYSFVGLKAAHVYFTYARFILNDDLRSTPSGLKRKLTNESEPISERSLSRYASQAREAANSYWNQCHRFLCRQTDSIYDDFCGKDNTGKTVTITAI